MTGLRPRPSQAGTDDDELLGLLQACHGRIRHFLALAATLGQDTEHPAGQVAEACAATRRYFTEALPLHVADEELSLAPRLRGWSPVIDAALDDMLAEHGEHAAALAALDAALAARSEDATAADGRRALAAVLPALTAKLEAHLAQEERVVFAVLTAALPATARQQVIAELRARRRPPSP